MLTHHKIRLITKIAAQVGQLLKSQHAFLATAESCTGGMLAETVTSVPGSSDWFECGLITYSNTAKETLLGVNPVTIAEYGAVSAETAQEMAAGALIRSNAHFSIAVTGIAGPDGGTAEKPVGTVWIAWAKQNAPPEARCYHFLGDRHAIREQAVQCALEGLLHDLAPPPVITLDGPSGTGKGTISQLLAQHLQWHYLDSGALFRVLALAALEHEISLEDEVKLASLATALNVRFISEGASIKTILDSKDITDAIRTESCASAASKIAVLPQVRHALMIRQRAFRTSPGLVTDGRDMGTVVFPDATLKFFLSASNEERAKRRYQQLKNMGLHASLANILEDLVERDTRDKQRNTAPLKPASDAISIDTTELSINQVLALVLEHVTTHLPGTKKTPSKKEKA